MLKCFVNSVFKDFLPKDAVEASTEVSEDDGDWVQSVLGSYKNCCDNLAFFFFFTTRTNHQEAQFVCA